MAAKKQKSKQREDTPPPSDAIQPKIPSDLPIETIRAMLEIIGDFSDVERFKTATEMVCTILSMDDSNVADTDDEGDPSAEELIDSLKDEYQDELAKVGEWNADPQAMVADILYFLDKLSTWVKKLKSPIVSPTSENAIFICASHRAVTELILCVRIFNERNPRRRFAEACLQDLKDAILNLVSDETESFDVRRSLLIDECTRAIRDETLVFMHQRSETITAESQFNLKIDHSEKVISREASSLGYYSNTIKWKNHPKKWIAFQKLMNGFPQMVAQAKIDTAGKARTLKLEMNEDLKCIGLRISRGNQWLLEQIPVKPDAS